MKANEFRVGNYLQDKEDKIAIIEKLTKDNYQASSGSITTLPLKPIPLTEEWLLKFGFESKTASVTHVNSYILGKIYLTNGLRSGIHYGDIEIKYVHQLQNLYFALTGKEITL